MGEQYLNHVASDSILQMFIPAYSLKLEKNI